MICFGLSFSLHNCICAGIGFCAYPGPAWRERCKLGSVYAQSPRRLPPGIRPHRNQHESLPDTAPLPRLRAPFAAAPALAMQPPWVGWS